MLLHFDYDGVLVDSFDQLLDAAQRATLDTGLGRPPTREDFETIADLTAASLAALLGVPDHGIELYARQMHAVMEAGGREPTLFPGVADLLRDLSRRHTIVIVTSNHDHLVRRGLSRVDPCVSLILDARQPGAKSARIRHSLKHFGCPPNESFMIGDTRGDLRHGKLAGVRTAGVTWGYQRRATLEQESPDFIVDCPRELLRLLNAVG